MTEEGYVVSVKGSVIRKAAFIINKGWLFSRGDALVSDKQTLFGNIFFRGVMKLLLEESEQIALCHEAVRGNLGDVGYRGKMRVDVCYCPREDGRALERREVLLMRPANAEKIE